MHTILILIALTFFFPSLWLVLGIAITTFAIVTAIHNRYHVSSEPVTVDSTCYRIDEDAFGLSYTKE